MFLFGIFFLLVIAGLAGFYYYSRLPEINFDSNKLTQKNELGGKPSPLENTISTKGDFTLITEESTRSIKVTGIVEGWEIYEGYDLLKIRTLSDNILINVVFLGDTNRVGLGRVQSGGKRLWSSVTISEMKTEIVGGISVEAEIVTWVSDGLDCKGNENCLELKKVVKDFGDNNAVLEKLADAGGGDKFTDDLNFGPVKTLLILRQKNENNQ